MIELIKDDHLLTSKFIKNLVNILLHFSSDANTALGLGYILIVY